METPTRTADNLTLSGRLRRESGFSEEMYLTPPLAVDSRRDSYDSGLSESPSPTPIFPMDLEEVEGKAKPKKKLKKKRLCESLSVARFKDAYRLVGEVLGEGSYGRVETCFNLWTDRECAVKIVSKDSWNFSRPKILKEIELFHLCRGRREIVHMVEYFEEDDAFYLVFEKADGGHLLRQVQRRVKLTEAEAAIVIRDLAAALAFLHGKSVAHRDLKLENVLCFGNEDGDGFLSVKLCDFDLCSAVYQTVTTPRLRSPVGSVEYMAPEVVEAFARDMDLDLGEADGEDEELTYDKRCDLWSLGVIAYVLLCGYVPFTGSCGKDCGWDDRGEECSECQRGLFRSIRSGGVVFHEQHWSQVSAGAKDLISRLLVLDPLLRMDASSVLDHPWIASQGNMTNACSNQTCDDGKFEPTEKVNILVRRKKLSFPLPAAPRLMKQTSLVIYPEDVGSNRWEL